MSPQDPQLHDTIDPPLIRANPDFRDLEAWRTGDSKAGARLIERYHHELLRYFWRRVPEHAEDLTQQTLLACIEQRDRIRDSRDFRPYLYGIAWRTHARARRRREHVPLDDGDYVPARDDRVPTPEQLYETIQRRRALDVAMRRVSSVNRRAMEMFYLEGYRGREIAETLRVPHATVRSRLSRAVRSVHETVSNSLDS